MGYFSNGTEGDLYEAQYCARCLHGQGPDGNACAVWALHLDENYNADTFDLLDALIPRSADGLKNLECRMFVDVGRQMRLAL